MTNWYVALVGVVALVIEFWFHSFTWLINQAIAGNMYATLFVGSVFGILGVALYNKSTGGRWIK